MRDEKFETEKTDQQKTQFIFDSGDLNVKLVWSPDCEQIQYIVTLKKDSIDKIRELIAVLQNIVETVEKNEDNSDEIVITINIQGEIVEAKKRNNLFGTLIRKLRKMFSS